MFEDKLKAYVIEKTVKPLDNQNGNEWEMVNMTEITEDGVWHCGLNYITSLEDAIEKSAKEKVPVWTKEYFESIKQIK